MEAARVSRHVCRYVVHGWGAAPGHLAALQHIAWILFRVYCWRHVPKVSVSFTARDVHVQQVTHHRSSAAPFHFVRFWLPDSAAFRCILAGRLYICTFSGHLSTQRANKSTNLNVSFKQLCAGVDSDRKQHRCNATVTAMTLASLVGVVLSLRRLPTSSLQVGKTVSELCVSCVRTNPSSDTALDLLRTADLKYALLSAVTGKTSVLTQVIPATMHLCARYRCPIDPTNSVHSMPNNTASSCCVQLRHIHTVVTM